ncbi:hypothetical protein FDP41_005248 [Naegleria fowleri]|uniref:SMP-30/Gluconolactonase/LRE-like region domain-containing protein n=1 Tax=Naegleria fowleri TaxID=5763 RepID=A0A6A5BNR9_NAEFO|nr:uncharacterized protein FDP41_005248 [Naegleria fowleri]KAF0975921.1 hypothetical protein FDP41_005248 [Naegleria fowleri]CAG4713576.1 unnamed protein product [Naegleria fowleri]
MKRCLSDSECSTSHDDDDDLMPHHDETKKRKITSEFPSTPQEKSILQFHPTQQQVKVILIDFVIQRVRGDDEAKQECFENNFLFGHLKHKLMNQKRLEAFSLQFKLTSCMIDHLHSPVEIKISNNHNCILISDYDLSSICVFDLKTLELEMTWPLFSNYFCIEYDYNERGNDALLIPLSNDQSRVYKFDLRNLLSRHCSKTTFNSLWKSEPIDSAHGIAVLMNSSPCRTGNQVFVCNHVSNCIHILRSDSGTCIQKIEISHPTAIAFSADSDLIVSEAFIDQKITIMKRNAENNSWVVVKQLGGKNGHSSFRYPVAVMCDMVNNNFFVVDALNNRIQVFSQNGVFIKSFDQLNKPSSACINERNGELYVCEIGCNNNQKVQIFR